MRLRVSGSGPTVIKLGGLAGGVGLYHEEIEAAARAGFRVAALDTTGDRADDPTDSPITWDGLAADVALALDRVGEASAILWGTSFGCLVALAAATRWPERTAGLLLCHPPGIDWRPRIPLALDRQARRGSDPERSVHRMFLVGFSTLTCWEALYPPALRRLGDVSRAAVEAATPSATISGKLALLWSESPGLPPAEARIPSSIVAASWDTVTPPGLARDLASRIPGCRFRLVAGCGHLASFSRPRASMRAFLEELRVLAQNKTPLVPPFGRDEGR